MTVENILTHGLKTSILGSNYKAECDENLTLLDKNRVMVGTFANRPAAGTTERFYFAEVFVPCQPEQNFTLKLSLLSEYSKIYSQFLFCYSSSCRNIFTGWK